MTVEELVKRVHRLQMYRFKGQPALYQPITLLWAIGRAKHGEPRLTTWGETERELRALLQRHGRHGERGRPDYPVAALHHKGLWEIVVHDDPVPTAHGDAELRRWFVTNQPLSGLPEAVYSLMRHSDLARAAVLDAILDRFHVRNDDQEFLRDVGLLDNSA